jgi:hypothetical protein
MKEHSYARHGFGKQVDSGVDAINRMMVELTSGMQMSNPLVEATTRNGEMLPDLLNAFLTRQKAMTEKLAETGENFSAKHYEEVADKLIAAAVRAGATHNEILNDVRDWVIWLYQSGAKTRSDYLLVNGAILDFYIEILLEFKQLREASGGTSPAPAPTSRFEDDGEDDEDDEMSMDEYSAAYWAAVNQLAVLEDMVEFNTKMDEVREALSLDGDDIDELMEDIVSAREALGLN